MTVFIPYPLPYVKPIPLYPSLSHTWYSVTLARPSWKVLIFLKAEGKMGKWLKKSANGDIRGLTIKYRENRSKTCICDAIQ